MVITLYVLRQFKKIITVVLHLPLTKRKKERKKSKAAKLYFSFNQFSKVTI